MKNHHPIGNVIHNALDCLSTAGVEVLLKLVMNIIVTHLGWICGLRINRNYLRFRRASVVGNEDFPWFFTKNANRSHRRVVCEKAHGFRKQAAESFQEEAGIPVMKLRILVSWLRSAGGDQSWKKAAGKSCRVLGGDQTVVVLWVLCFSAPNCFVGVSEGMYGNVWKESGKGRVTMSSPPGSPAQESRKAEEQSVTWKHEIQQLSQVRERCWIAQGRELVLLDFQMAKTPGLDWKMRKIGIFRGRPGWLVCRTCVLPSDSTSIRKNECRRSMLSW